MEDEVSKSMCKLNDMCLRGEISQKKFRRIAEYVSSASAGRQGKDASAFKVCLYRVIIGYAANCIDTREELSSDFSGKNCFAEISGAQNRVYCLTELLNLIVFANDTLISESDAMLDPSIAKIKISGLLLGEKTASAILSPVKFKQFNTYLKKPIYKDYIISSSEKENTTNIRNSFIIQLSTLGFTGNATENKDVVDKNDYLHYGYMSVWSFCISVLMFLLISVNSAFLFLMLSFDASSLVLLFICIFKRINSQNHRHFR